MSDPTNCPTCGAPLPADAASGACPKCLLEAGLATGGASAPGSGERVPTPEELAPKFPGLIVEELLGRGGMGVVYRARHKALDRHVALKVLPERVADDRAFADRFQREARALAKLQHPNIVAVHDFGRSDGLFWLVMEYVDGLNIRQAMRAGQIGPKEALAIVPQICDALQYAHEHGVVHRDIKPENVLLDRAGRVKVADFGLAKLTEQGGAADPLLTAAGQVMGTPHYMAPEQWERPTTVDHRADIYSLGVVFYEMLTGELPLGRFDPPSAKVQVDVRLDEVVLRSLQKAPERRYQQASEVRTEVDRVAEHPAPVAAPPAPTEEAKRPRRFWFTLAYDSAEEKARGGRLSKMAVAGALGIPAGVAVAACLAAFDHLDRFAVLMGGLVALVGWIASIVAWVRIAGAPGRLRGTGWAIAGTFLPLLAPCLSAPVWLLTGTSPPQDRAREIVESRDGIYGDVAVKWRKLQDLGLDAPLHHAFQLYDREEADVLRSLKTDGLLADARRGELGLPLLPADRLPRPLSEFQIEGVQYEDDSSGKMLAIVTAKAGDTTIRFPMKGTVEDDLPRGMSQCDFAVGQVEIQTGPSAPPTTFPPVRPFTAEDERLVSSIWAEAAARKALPAPADVIGLYPPEQRSRLSAMSPESLAAEAKTGALGLPLMPDSALPNRLVHYGIVRIDVDKERGGFHATLVASDDGKRSLRVPLFLSGRNWYFEAAQVVVE